MILTANHFVFCEKSGEHLIAGGVSQIGTEYKLNMALIKCHECRGQVSDHARTCPHCGAPVIATIKRRQKAELKYLVVKFVFVLIFAIFAWVGVRHIFNQVMAPLQNLQQKQQPH